MICKIASMELGDRRGCPKTEEPVGIVFIFDLIDVKRQHVDGIFILSLLYCLVLIYTSEPVYIYWCYKALADVTATYPIA